MGKWSLWEVAARYEQNEIMQLRQEMSLSQQDDIDDTDTIDESE